MVFTSLAHHIDMHVLRTAYAATRKDGAVGLDGQTAADYAVHLEANLQSLLDRFKSGQYVAPPVRRVHSPKGDGRKTRPIGIPTFEDKVLQRAVVMVLESVYEQDFRDCSFGFRPGRSAHQALQHLWEQTMVMGGGWVIDLDIQGFFDVLDHSHLRGFLDRRVRDGVLRRAIDKWLKPVDVQLSRRPHLAEVAQPSVAEEIDAVEAVPPPPRAIPSPANDGHPLGRARSEAIRRGAGCGREQPTRLQSSWCKVGHVAMPHPGMGNHPGDAWCKRPGRPARRCCGGCNLGA